MADIAIADHLLTKTHVADEALAANRFVKGVTSTGVIPHVVYADGGDPIIGVTRGAYDSAELADIVYCGTAYVEASENIAVNDKVSADTDGKAQVLAGSEFYAGIAVTEGNTGELVKVKLA